MSPCGRWVSGVSPCRHSRGTAIRVGLERPRSCSSSPSAQCAASAASANPTDRPAARLTEFSKRLPGRLCASARSVGLADAAEAAHWALGEEEQLRGRSSPTRIAVPQTR